MQESIGIPQENLQKFFRALGDPTRYRIFQLLTQGRQCNCEISRECGLSLSLVSHHLRVLEELGLLEAERDQSDSRWIYYSLNREVLDGFRAEFLALTDPAAMRERETSCAVKQCKTVSNQQCNTEVLSV